MLLLPRGPSWTLESLDRLLGLSRVPCCCLNLTPFAPTASGVEEGVLMGLAAMMAPLEVTPGQELCLAGDVAGAMWLLLDGEGRGFAFVSLS